MKKSVFTLVELIVVITILATVAFISFQWYTQNDIIAFRFWDRFRSSEVTTAG